jgi:hypothetical protein
MCCSWRSLWTCMWLSLLFLLILFLFAFLCVVFSVLEDCVPFSPVSWYVGPEIPITLLSGHLSIFWGWLKLLPQVWRSSWYFEGILFDVVSDHGVEEVSGGSHGSLSLLSWRRWGSDSLWVILVRLWLPLTKCQILTTTFSVSLSMPWA